MVRDGQKVWMDGMDGQRQNYIPPTLSGDNDHRKYFTINLHESMGLGRDPTHNHLLAIRLPIDCAAELAHKEL